MEKIFFIADTHFGDKNIIEYEGRPFNSIDEMDEELIKRWNNKINSEDIVFVVGDFSNYDFEKTKEICLRLNGRKRLILGNHDILSIKEFEECGFERVYDYPIIFKNFWLVSHEPLYMNNNMPYANIYGHVHNNDMYKDYSNHSFCISVERINYSPISFEEIQKKIQ